MALIHWWPLNGNLKDQGLNPVDLVNGGTTVNTNGKIGSCYSFDGSDDYLSITSSDLYSVFKGGSQPFSICLWIYNEDGGGRSIIFGDYGLTGTQQFNIEKTTAEYLRFYWAGDIVNPVPNSALTVNTWMHVGVVYNGVNIKFYLNGALIHTITTTLAAKTKTTGAHYFGRDSRTGTTAFKGRMNDLRIYDHALSAKEIKDISRCLLIHYDFEDEEIDEPTINLGNTSSNYSNQTIGSAMAASGWGGDAGTVTFYTSGGYNGYPYKVYHKTATGSGGIYKKTADDITIEEGKTYTMSVYIKASVNITNASSYSFNINRGSDNNYINYGSSFNITTEWKRLTKTFTATSAQAGKYGEMSIIYDDNVTDYYVYFSGFQIEEKSYATKFVIGTRDGLIPDSSGYGYDGTIQGEVKIVDNDTEISSLGKHSAKFNGNNSRIITNFPAAGPITFVFNFKFDSSSTFHVLDCRRSSDGKGYQPFYGGLGYGIQYYTNGANGSGSVQPTVAECGFSSSDTSKWYHFVGVSNTTGTYVYLNGVLIKSSTSYKCDNFSSLLLSIGARYNSTNWFNGKMSDFKVYATSFSAADVLKEYQSFANIDKAYNLTAREFSEDSSRTAYGQLENHGIFNIKYIRELETKTLSDGSKWICIFKHDVRTNTECFASKNEAKFCVNKENRFSILGNIADFKSTDNYYEFIYSLPELGTIENGFYNRWKQTSDPNTAAVGTSTGYAAVGTLKWTNYFSGGIAKSADSNPYLDTTVSTSTGNWWGAIGQTSLYQNIGFPSANGGNQKCVELWIRYDNTNFKGYFKTYNNGVLLANAFYEF